MARKKREGGASGGNAPWLNTFADLMNLLLCFFVMLFAMSDVNGQKFEDISVSLSNAFGIFEGGGSAIGEGQMISSGMTQLNNLDEYYSNMGENSHESDVENEGEYDPTTMENTEEAPFESAELNEAYAKIREEMEQVTEAMYDEVSVLTEQYNLGDYVELSLDPDSRFVQLSLKGSILFESGKADIIEEAEPILSRLGDILARYDEYIIEIIGHTDNVPMTSPTFKDNNWLSSARALNAAEFLIDNNKLDPDRVKYSGRGEYEPITTNDTPEGRAKNRRIEIRIYNEYSGR